MKTIAPRLPLRKGLSLSQTKTLLQSHQIRLKKSLGQNLLIDGEVLRCIVSAADLHPEDIVVEVGPGLGILTEELAQGARMVFAIEIDGRLASILAQRLADFPNVTVINDNVLQIDPFHLLQQSGYLDTEGSYKVVANLPYYVTSPILRHFLEASLKPRLMVVTVQKEVAQRIVAKPGNMSLLSVSVQLYGNPTIVRYVAACSFYPSPNVDSAIVRIEVPKHPTANIPDVDTFFRVARSGFSQPRKQLRNAIASGLELPLERVVELLNQAGIDHKRRAQTLSLEEWAKLAQGFKHLL